MEYLAKEEPQHFVLVHSRLDYLETLQAWHGQDALNQLFNEVARLFDDIVGEDEWVARLGTHDVAVVIPDSSDEEGEGVAKDLQQ